MADDLLGKPLWCELLTTDVEAAKSFYSAIVGWTVETVPGGADGYQRLANAAGQPMGGLMTTPAGLDAPPHWMMYIGVPKLEDAVREIERRGGATVSPLIDIPNIGRMFTVRDPQGAMFEIFEPSSSERTPDAEPGLGDVSWRELYTDDAAKAMTFYREVFGWQQTGTFDMGAMGTYYLFGRSFPLGGMMTKPPAMAQVPSHWSLYFRVKDVDAEAEHVKRLGGQILNGPMDVPGDDRIVQCMDPQGAAFALHAVKR